MPLTASATGSAWVSRTMAPVDRAGQGAARRAGGNVVEFRISDSTTPNFHQGIIAFADRTVAVICVRYTAVLAIAVPRNLGFTPVREAGPLTFVDMPVLAAALTDIGAEVAGFVMLAAAELAGPIDPAQWPGISPNDLQYWKPSSLGEALFNYWD